MRRKWIIPVACLCIVAASVWPRSPAAYIVNKYLAASYHADTMLNKILSESGIKGDPDLIVTMVASNEDIAAGESLDFEIGDISSYWEVYAVFLATTFDTAMVYIGTSDTPGWATGNTAYFDRDPSTVTPDHWSLDDGLSTYGTCIPLMNTYGTFLIGEYGVGRVTADAGDNIVGLTIIIKKRK